MAKASLNMMTRTSAQVMMITMSPILLPFFLLLLLLHSLLLSHVPFTHTPLLPLLSFSSHKPSTTHIHPPPQDYVKSKIYMTAVDTGWINDEKPIDLAAKHHEKHNFQVLPTSFSSKGMEERTHIRPCTHLH
jgi:hypothetical protein